MSSLNLLALNSRRCLQCRQNAVLIIGLLAQTAGPAKLGCPCQALREGLQLCTRCFGEQLLCKLQHLVL